ncbi:hypothetical protein SDC9_202768 [bioreactor metagenome]|uniref:Uncharacterized protein n=1 Tax=bioreactor metagenome TaxID=1076179 RepID=A0A645IXC4_9ZZZZ
MPKFIVLILIIAAVSIIDIRSMIQSRCAKEIIPYFLLMLLSGVVGCLHLANPYRKSIAQLILSLLNIQG